MFKIISITVLVCLVICTNLEAQQFRSSYAGETPLCITTIDDTYKISIDSSNISATSDCFNPIWYISIGETVISARYVFDEENSRKLIRKYEYNLITKDKCEKLSESEGSGIIHLMSQFDDRLLVVNKNDIILVDDKADYIVKDISQYTNGLSRFQKSNDFILVSQGDVARNGTYLNIFNKELRLIKRFLFNGNVYSFTSYGNTIFYISDSILYSSNISSEELIEYGEIDSTFKLQEVIQNSQKDEMVVFLQNSEKFKLLKVNNNGGVLDSTEGVLHNRGSSQSIFFDDSVFEINERYKLLIKS